MSTIEPATILLFAFGLIPQYISVFFVETHYTNFWTGFWNIFGLTEVTLGLTTTVQDIAHGLGISLVVLGLVIILYMTLLGGRAEISRRLGASWLTTTLSWGLLVGFYIDLQTGIFVMILHALLIGALYLLTKTSLSRHTRSFRLY